MVHPTYEANWSAVGAIVMSLGFVGSVIGASWRIVSHYTTKQSADVAALHNRIDVEKTATVTREAIMREALEGKISKVEDGTRRAVDELKDKIGGVQRDMATRADIDRLRDKIDEALSARGDPRH